MISLNGLDQKQLAFRIHGLIWKMKLNFPPLPGLLEVSQIRYAVFVLANPGSGGGILTGVLSRLNNRG